MPAKYLMLDDRGVIAVRGAEARDLLQRIITNDMDRLSPGQAIYAALLTPQGKYLFDFFVVQDGEGFLLDCERARAGDLLKRLRLYRLRAAVELQDESEECSIVALYDVDAPSDYPEFYSDPRADGLGLRSILPRAKVADFVRDLLPGNTAEYEALRIDLAVPDGSRDFDIDKSVPLEMNFEELNGVDFDKGCFIGQEVTARMKHRSLIRKRLVPVAIDGPVPAEGSDITLAGRVIGQLRSVAGQNGLALIRLDHLTDATEPPEADGARLLPYAPDWADFDLPSFD